jgi:hypothetical protein
MSLRVLFIDDEPDNVIPAREELKISFPEAESEVCDFGRASEKIGSFEPDLIILDLMENQIGAAQVNSGRPIEVHIWEQRFCPVIFYTASEEGPQIQHPLVAVVRKGSGSEEQIREKVQAYLPHIAALATVSTEIDSSLRRALRESKPRVFGDGSSDNQLLIRSIRRRVAASMDEKMASGEPNLLSWEQYLCPPSISHLLTGDILRLRGGDNQDPSSYRVVLTPSCDLVESEGRRPKVESVLLAKCSPISRILSDLNITVNAGMKPKEKASAKAKVARFLTQGYGHSSFPIAELPGEFPVMAADFRILEIASTVDLASDKYERVASVDAPFRELFVWAYLSAAGRPGMPDRDFGPWADSIIEEVQRLAGVDR